MTDKMPTTSADARSGRRKARRTAGIAATIAALAAFAAGPAYASKDAEAYIGAKAQGAISSLAEAGAPDARAARFGALMDQFADVSELSGKMLGVYGRALHDNPEMTAAWTSAFRDYAMATYEDRLDQYRRARLTVTGSRDAEQNGKTCSRVATQLNQDAGKPVQVYWYVCKVDAASWRVRDVGLDVGGGEIKVLLSQRAQFEAVLGKNGGDINDLIAQLRARTSAVRARIAARRG